MAFLIKAKSSATPAADHVQAAQQVHPAAGQHQQLLTDYYASIINRSGTKDQAQKLAAYHAATGQYPPSLPKHLTDGAQRTAEWRAKKTHQLGAPPKVVNPGSKGSYKNRGAAPASGDGTVKAPRTPKAAPTAIPRPAKGFLDIDQHKVQHPGIRGGKGYWNVHGVWVYGTPSYGHPGHPQPPETFTNRKRGYFDPQGDFQPGGQFDRDVTKAGQTFKTTFHDYRAGTITQGWYDQYGFVHLHPKAPPEDANAPVPPDWESIAPAGYQTRNKGHFNDEGYFDPQGIKRRPEMAGKYDWFNGLPIWYDADGFAHFHGKVEPPAPADQCQSCGRKMSKGEIQYAKDLGLAWLFCEDCGQAKPNADPNKLSDRQYDRMAIAVAARNLVHDAVNDQTFNSSGVPQALRQIPAHVVASAMHEALATYSRPSQNHPKGKRESSIDRASELETWARAGFTATLALKLQEANLAQYVDRNQGFWAKNFPDDERLTAELTREMVRSQMRRLQAQYPKFAKNYDWEGRVKFELAAIHMPEYRSMAKTLMGQQKWDDLRKLQRGAGKVTEAFRRYRSQLDDQVRLPEMYNALSQHGLQTLANSIYRDNTFETIVKDSLQGVGTTKTLDQAADEMFARGLDHFESKLDLQNPNTDPAELIKRWEALKDWAAEARGLISSRMFSTQAAMEFGAVWQDDDVKPFVSTSSLPTDFQSMFLKNLIPANSTWADAQNMVDMQMSIAQAGLNQIADAEIDGLKKKAAEWAKKWVERAEQDLGCKIDIPHDHPVMAQVRQLYEKYCALRTSNNGKTPPTFGGARRITVGGNRSVTEAQARVDRNHSHKGAPHNAKVHYVLNVEYDMPEFDAEVQRCGGPSKANVTPLYHASAPGKALSVVMHGCMTIYDLRQAGINVPTTAQMLGDGFYMTPNSNKAAGYGFGSWGGSNDLLDGGMGCMFEVDAVLGKIRDPKSTDTQWNPDKWRKFNNSPYTLEREKFDSIWHNAGLSPVAHRGTLQNDEVLVYQPEQVKLRRILLITK